LLFEAAGQTSRAGQAQARGYKNRGEVSVFVSSEDAAVPRMVVGRISADCLDSNSTTAYDGRLRHVKKEGGTRDRGRNVTVLVSSKHAEIKPVVVGTILEVRNDGISIKDENKSTLTGGADIDRLTIPQLKLELSGRDVKFRSKSTKAALAAMLKSTISQSSRVEKVSSRHLEIRKKSKKRRRSDNTSTTSNIDTHGGSTLNKEQKKKNKLRVKKKQRTSNVTPNEKSKKN